MSDYTIDGKPVNPLPEMEEQLCNVCGRPTIVAKTYAGEVYCTEHDPILIEELKSDGI
ncbi:MAG TPA: hypothetical protein VE439_04555 [Anaerolineae bacterium]|nr:hypothetical protein [Anaerolineae bacterium]